MAFGHWFFGKFGVNYRNRALICSGDKDIARGYVKTGTSTLIEVMPLEPFSICFSANCLDLFGYFQFAGREVREDPHKVQMELESLEFVEYRNGGLDEAVASGNEVMVYAEYFAYRRLM